MTAPRSGVKVRMYRQGHGDCFLLAFPSSGKRPSYVLIDCGYKPGSTVHADIGAIVRDIAASTGNFIDTIVLTHEHQDHLNGIWKKGTPYFDEITCGEAWFAWTEDPKDTLANELRKQHRDQLLGLVAARQRLAAAGGGAALRRLDDLLSLELGTDLASQFHAAAADPSASINKQGMKLVKDRAKNGVRYIRPHEEIMALPRVKGVRVFALGPPRSATLLYDEDPKDAEAFPGQGLTAMAPYSFYAAAQQDGHGIADAHPFARRFGVAWSEAFGPAPGGPASFFRTHYGTGPATAKEPAPPSGDDGTHGDRRHAAEVADDAEFRRIDSDWLHTAEYLSLTLNRGVNNTSLVLAFELPTSRKVLLFAADAQRGNWRSWTARAWKDGPDVITARDLLARTVLYKVGHHGSHNATLNGRVSDDYANLSWMAQGQYSREFTAMIPAVPAWAYKQDPVWAHPLESIRLALHEKAAGRVFQTDTDVLKKPDAVSDQEWKAFIRLTKVTPLYFEYVIRD